MKKPEDSKPQEHEAVLQRHYSWMRNGVPMTVTLCGLLLTLVAIWIGRAQHWAWENSIWAIGLGLSLAAGALLWAVRQMSLHERARRVDQRIQSMNRLETAAQFAAIDDPVMRAQRQETAEFLKQHPVHRRPGWMPWLVGAACFLLMAHAVTWLGWAQPWHVAKAAPKPVASPTPSAALPLATITIHSPKSETKAAAIEEVPLEATADSTSGLKNLSLEIAVNGVKKLSVPVPLSELAKAGPHKIETSIYMDQLGVQPFDMVSYYLRADRITAMNAPETASGMQFVEIKPFRDDIMDGRTGQRQQQQQPGQGQTAQQQQEQDALRLAGSMKVAQLRLMKENFTLAHSDLTHDQPVWKQENTRVGGEQGVLADKAQQVQQLMIQNGEAAEIVDLISQAKPLIADAAKKIKAEQNVPAVPVQGKALAAITEIEKYIRHVLADQMQAQGQPPPPEVADPFNKRRDVALKKRQDTQAGQLENLAREQKRLSDDLDQGKTASDAPQPGATPADPNRITGSPTERQTKISQQVGSMLNGSNFDQETTNHLEKGHEQTEEALKQLDAEDPNRAREPAATAAQELQAAADAMNKAGQQQAQQQMQAALNDMNNAAQQARNAPNAPRDQQAKDAAKNAAQQVDQTQQRLAQQAQRQQETGSQKSAAQMAAMSKALNDQLLKQQLQKLQEQPRDASNAKSVADRLDSLAHQAAPAPEHVTPTREQLTALMDSMNRERTNLQRLAQLDAQAGAPGIQPPTPGLPNPQTPGAGQNGQPERSGTDAGAGGQSGMQPGGAPGPAHLPIPALPGSPGLLGTSTLPGMSSQPGGQGQQAQNGSGQNPGQQGSRQRQTGQTGQQGQGGQGQNLGQQGGGQGQTVQRGQQGGGQGQTAQTGQNGQQGNGREQMAHNNQQNGQQGGQGQAGPNGDGQNPQNQGQARGSSGMGRQSGGNGGQPGGDASALQPRNIAATSQRQQFAADLLDQITMDSDAVAGAMPNSPLIMQAHQRIKQAATAVQTTAPTAAVIAYGKLNEPLSMMIDALRDQLNKSVRQDELTDQSAELAPPAYRSAVADYFERLSRDYQTAPAGDKPQ